MPTNVITIKVRSSGPYCAPLGFHFPAIFRLTGYSWKLVADNLVPDEAWPATEYALSDDLTERLARPVFTMIRHLDPALDDGWLIVRHHRSSEAAEGYIAAAVDLEDDPGGPGMLYRTDAGFFTILHRAARPGCENHLIGYFADSQPNWFCGVRSDGSNFDDDGLFYKGFEPIIMPAP